MDDLRQRDLSQVPEDELTTAERRELRRRFGEFVGMLRRKGDPLLEQAAAKPEAKRVRRWDPAQMKRGKGSA